MKTLRQDSDKLLLSFLVIPVIGWILQYMQQLQSNLNDIMHVNCWDIRINPYDIWYHEYRTTSDHLSINIFEIIFMFHWNYISLSAKDISIWAMINSSLVLVLLCVFSQNAPKVVWVFSLEIHQQVRRSTKKSSFAVVQVSSFQSI